ncbi:hypothetical protein LCGC14_0568880 [marine sediment metagenome]|uniref:Uncharacterized protein n=1 Tax=marine sediment metagenome TaxID=412755 RepID=A0A0F9S3K1_9ZZZZ|nr:hypothetical protein [Phycisphaerae bacterium]
MRFSTLVGMVFGLLCVVAFAVSVAFCLGTCAKVGDSIANAPPSPTMERIDTTPDDRVARQLVMEVFQQSGILAQIGSETGWKGAIVREGFYDLSFDDKTAVASNVWIWFCDGSSPSRSVTLRDERTNKKIGSYTPAYGLKLR